MRPIVRRLLARLRVTPAPVLVAGALAAACGRQAPRVEFLESVPAASMPEAADPALAIDPGTGDLLLTWVGGAARAGWRLYFARSGDGGGSWSNPVAITPDTGLVHPHGEAAPRLVAAPGGRIAVVWPHGFTVPGRRWPATHLQLTRSVDGGTSWSSPITLNDDTLSPPMSHTFQGLARTGDSGLTAAWLDERRGGHIGHEHVSGDSTAAGDATIYAVSSSDFGTSWGPNQPQWGAVCPCCRVALGRAPDGSALAAWRKHFPGNIRDVVVTAVGDRSEPKRVHEDGWEYPGCPHSGPAMAVDTTGHTYIVWYTGKTGEAGVYLARGTGTGGFDAAPVTLMQRERLPTAHPAVAALPQGGAIAAWDVDAGGSRGLSVAVVRSGDSKAHSLTVPATDGASYPQLAVLRDGGAIVAWTELAGEANRLRLARVTARD